MTEAITRESRKWYLATALVLGTIVFVLWFLFVPPRDPRVNCDSISLAEISERWQSDDILKRRSVVECVGGSDWPGDRSTEFIVSESLLYGMKRDQVIELLGTPDYEREGKVSYDLGDDMSSRFDRILNMGWESALYHFVINFEDDDGIARRVHISS